MNAPRKTAARYVAASVALTTVPNVELLEVGEDWATSTGGGNAPANSGSGGGGGGGTNGSAAGGNGGNGGSGFSYIQIVG